MRNLSRRRALVAIAACTLVFLVVNTAVAAAADGGSDGGRSGLLAPLNIRSSEGVPLDGYDLGADGGSPFDASGQTRTLLLGGLFTLVRLAVGLACWLIKFAFQMPLFTLLLGPAQAASDAYRAHVVGALGLEGLMLSWAFVFGLILFMRGRVGRGLGEILLTLLIAAFAASSLVRPDYLLGRGGPLDQVHSAALEVAQITVSSYNFNGATAATGPCAAVVGPAQDTCRQGHHTTAARGDSEACAAVTGPARDACRTRRTGSGTQADKIARPLQDVLTNALVVKPYMLLEYGRILDPHDADTKEAYKAHLTWVSTGYHPKPKLRGSGKDPCDSLPGPARQYCGKSGKKAPALSLDPDPTKGALDQFKTAGQKRFEKFTDDLKKSGKAGEEAAAYASDPTWDRVGAVLLLLIAVAAITMLVVAMTLVLLGSQGADAAAAAVGGIALVWGMLPGPSRQAIWRWLAIFMVSVLVMFTAAAFIPIAGIAVDAILTNGPDLLAERLLLIDALALALLAFHRRLVAGVSSFGERMAVRMRYAKVGGTHLPGDSSEVGAALAMAGWRGPGGFGGAGGLPLGNGGGGGAGPGGGGGLGTRARLLGHIAALTDTTGVPGAGGLAGAALAEARRGGAPFALAGRGLHGLLIGSRPDEALLAKWRKPTVADARPTEDGTMGPGGPPRKVDPITKEVVYSPRDDGDLLSTRLHNRMVRFRGYRVAYRAGRFAYGATVGLPDTVTRADRGATRFSEDVRTQLRVARSRVRQDAAAWSEWGDGLGDIARVAGAPIDEASQRAYVAGTVYGGAAARAARTAARDAAAGAAIYTSPSTGSPAGPGASASQEADAQAEARRRILDALMRAQRATWDETPWWGGDDE